MSEDKSRSAPAPAPLVREFRPDDAAAVAELFAAYMQEMFGTGSAMSPEVLLRDGMGLHFNLIIAFDAQHQPAGFAAWRMAYDLHHAVAGAEVPDLFVARCHRGRGLSIRLLAAVAQDAQGRGGTYIKGEVLTDDPRRMQQLHRVAVGFSGESVYVSGKAFRQLAQLTGVDARALIRGLPTPAMSREP
jgi:predicted GNAT superfamily acetyltransferase